jgi:HD superfamily phosphohydrolase YqeK
MKFSKEKELELSVCKAKKYIRKIKDPGHNMLHVRSVVKYALEIADFYPKVDKSAIEVASWWHDTGRLFDKIHETLSAEMAYNDLIKRGMNKKFSQKVYDAIVYHGWDMKPKTLEGEIIYDADKLDFISINRFKSRLKNQDFLALKSMANLLPFLRNNFLHLNISKEIYDKQILGFIKYVKSVRNKKIDLIKSQIINWSDSLINLK